MDAPPHASNAYVGGPHDPPAASPRTPIATLVACAALSLCAGVALGRGTAPAAAQNQCGPLSHRAAPRSAHAQRPRSSS